MTNSLRFWRKQRAISQTRLAEKIGVEQPMVSWFENGDKEPTVETWENIAAALNVPVDVLFAPPPISFGGTADSIVERVSSIPTVGEESGKSRKARRPQGFGRVTFLTPSQAKVGVQLQKTIKLADDEWDGVRVWIELPCEDDREAILETKAEAIRYCTDFVDQEMRRIVQEYRTQFNDQRVEGFDAIEESGLLENN